MTMTSMIDDCTHSKTELSFWSPQMRISAMDLSVSTKRLRLDSVTVWFRERTEYKYLKYKRNILLFFRVINGRGIIR